MLIYVKWASTCSGKDIKVELKEFPVTKAWVKKHKGHYKKGCDALKEMKTLVGDNGKGEEWQMVMVMYDDPHQTPKEECKSEIGFIDFPGLPDMVEAGFEERTLQGAFAAAETVEREAEELGALHEYLWKEYLPNNGIKPRTAEGDYCLQVTTMSPDGETVTNEVFVPIQPQS